jgi:hypothetical protein
MNTVTKGYHSRRKQRRKGKEEKDFGKKMINEKERQCQKILQKLI